MTMRCRYRPYHPDIITPLSDEYHAVEQAYAEAFRLDQKKRQNATTAGTPPSVPVVTNSTV